ncbi:tetratricopeptide (TPR) repeat protein [Flavobacterium sp. 28A]|uniref:tetratricopeptide repeat protein n=1 Tax=Flavobacterium sp. 28A TaxID=2735895 RepID=UPI001C2D798A|nr:flagellar motor protein MotB [Flavobacterium sp. 28A]NRT17158.1 tetratricopeptide (TPR) repeat protein [Flavobacterium sp. 28A]
MKKSLFSCIILFSFISCSLYSQKNKTINIEKSKENYAYVDAIKTYEKIANKGYRSDELFEKLANAYYFKSKFEEAAKWYKELFAMNDHLDIELYYRYSNALNAIGQEENAKKIMSKIN